MFRAVDRIVVVVPDLEAAIAAYGGAGFNVMRGGRHNIGTHNALIAFADGSYIELIAFLNPVPGHPWYGALQSSGGLVDFCMQTDDLDSDVAALRAAGAAPVVLDGLDRDAGIAAGHAAAPHVIIHQVTWPLYTSPSPRDHERDSIPASA